MSAQDYKRLYATLAELVGWREDVPGNEWADLLRLRLYQAWATMTAAEREPFLGPGTLDRRVVQERQTERVPMRYLHRPRAPKLKPHKKLD